MLICVGMQLDIRKASRQLLLTETYKSWAIDFGFTLAFISHCVDHLILLNCEIVIHVKDWLLCNKVKLTCVILNVQSQ